MSVMLLTSKTGEPAGTVTGLLLSSFSWHDTVSAQSSAPPEDSQEELGHYAIIVIESCDHGADERGWRLFLNL